MIVMSTRSDYSTCWSEGRPHGGRQGLQAMTVLTVAQHYLSQTLKGTSGRLAARLPNPLQLFYLVTEIYSHASWGAARGLVKHSWPVPYAIDTFTSCDLCPWPAENQVHSGLLRATILILAI